MQMVRIYKETNEFPGKFNIQIIRCFLYLFTDTLPDAFKYFDEMASKDFGLLMTQLTELLFGEDVVDRLNAAKEIIRQLSSPAPFVIAAKKAKWLKVNEDSRKSIVTNVRLRFEMFCYCCFVLLRTLKSALN